MAVLRPGASPAARRAEWRAQTRLRKATERSLQRAISEELTRVGRAAAAGFEMDGLLGVNIAMADHAQRVEAALLPRYRTVMIIIGERLMDALKRDALSEFLRFILLWIEIFGAAKVVQISETTRTDIVEAIIGAQSEGLGVAQIAKRIRERTGGVIGRKRAWVIARTETHSAAGAATDSALTAMSLPDIKREWIATEDARTRETHRIADGQIRPQGEPFDVGAAKLMFPGDPDGPAKEIIQCFPATTRVSSVIASHATRRWYDGDLVQVKTAAGNELAGTPNHPVLTLAGWKPLGCLNQGDHLVCRDFGQSMARGEPHINRADPLISEIFDALQTVGPLCRVPFGHVNFHGDRPSQDVDVVAPAGVLLGDRLTTAHQHGGKFVLPNADLAQGILLAHCLLDENMFSLWFAANSVMRSGCQLLAFSGSGIRHSKIHRLAARSPLNSRFVETLINFSTAGHPECVSDALYRFTALEPTNNIGSDGITGRLGKARASLVKDDTASDEMSTDCISIASERGGDLGNAHSIGVHLDSIVDCHRVEFSGHVYNLSDVTGWFIANNVIVHNCRCVTAAVIDD